MRKDQTTSLPAAFRPGAAATYPQPWSTATHSRNHRPRKNAWILTAVRRFGRRLSAACLGGKSGAGENIEPSIRYSLELRRTSQSVLPALTVLFGTRNIPKGFFFFLRRKENKVT